MRSMVGRRLSPLAAALAFALVSALLVMGAAPAQANHGSRTLNSPDEILGETGSPNPEGNNLLVDTPVSIEFQLSEAPDAGQTINIDVEHTAGPNDPDRSNSPGTPDGFCDITAPATSCTYTYTGLQATSSTARDRIMGWIDHDKFQSTVEADTQEGRRASQQDCEEEDPSTTNNTGCPPVHSSYSPGTGGTNCDILLPAEEPDCTDVVEVDYDTAGSEARFLDCDDSGPPDTERETNPSTTTTQNSSETYRCQVRDQFGSGYEDADGNGVRINGEVIDPINDPDTPDGESFATPDYGCEETGVDPDDPIFGETGICDIVVTQSENELGTTRICWWVGDPSAGAALCGSNLSNELVNENQVANGSDTGNDLADSNELTWESPSTFVIDCEPETSSKPTATTHTITCSAKSATTQRSVSGVNIQGEITGAGDPDQSDSPQNPDRSCTTANDGTCQITHTSTTTGESLYRIWINDGQAEPRVPQGGVDEDVDLTEGRNEGAQPGEKSEADSTDVVQNTWTQAPTTITMEPESDTAQIGECNPYTITATSGSGTSTAPVAGVIIDVEQIHALATDQTTNNEPTVSFCTPATGPNPSSVDTTKGDLGPNSAQTNDRETPDNPGTAGGETTNPTDSNGKVTIGISATAGNGSNGEGQVTITAFFDANDNDDPDASEAKDTSTKTWTAPAGPGGRTIDCEPETAETETDQQHTVTCTVRNAAGQPESGVGVTFSETGPGEFASSAQTTTNAQGQASVTVRSDDGGEQTITGTITNSSQNEPDTDECNRPANDPSGSPQGVCSDSVTNTWVDVTAECEDDEDNDGDGRTDFPQDPGCSSVDDDSEAGEPECQDNADNDNDGQTDHPADPGCSSPTDDDETDPADEKCPGYENVPGNHVVGSEGPDVLVGSEDGDIICGLGGNDQIDGLGGNDVITGGSGDDTIDGGEGSDDILAQDGDDTVFGNEGDDEIAGGPGDDELSGNGGKDALLGGGGNDVLKGNAGNDFVNGAGGNDHLNGGSGNDNLKGGKGNDTLRGGSGNDTLRGGRGRDEFYGGPGKDSCDATRKEKAKSC